MLHAGKTMPQGHLSGRKGSRTAKEQKPGRGTGSSGSVSASNTAARTHPRSQSELGRNKQFLAQALTSRILLKKNKKKKTTLGILTKKPGYKSTLCTAAGSSS